MAVSPVRAQPEEADRLDPIQRHLFVSQLVCTRKLARQTALAGALGAGAVPAQQFEVVGRLVPIGPGNRQQLPGTVGEDVEGSFRVG